MHRHALHLRELDALLWGQSLKKASVYHTRVVISSYVNYADMCCTSGNSMPSSGGHGFWKHLPTLPERSGPTVTTAYRLSTAAATICNSSGRPAQHKLSLLSANDRFTLNRREAYRTTIARTQLHAYKLLMGSYMAHLNRTDNAVRADPSLWGTVRSHGVQR